MKQKFNKQEQKQKKREKEQQKQKNRRKQKKRDENNIERKKRKKDEKKGKILAYLLSIAKHVNGKSQGDLKPWTFIFY